MNHGFKGNVWGETMTYGLKKNILVETVTHGFKQSLCVLPLFSSCSLEDFTQNDRQGLPLYKINYFPFLLNVILKYKQIQHTTLHR